MTKRSTTSGRERISIDNVLIEKILRDSVDGKLPKLQIAKKRRVCFNTVKSILLKYEYGFWDNKTIPAPPKSPLRRADPSVTKIRAKLSMPERMKELSADSIEIAELTLKRMKDLLNDPNQTISASQLTSFMQSVSAFAIKKVDGPAKTKDESKPISSRDQFNAFKDQVS